MMGGIGISLVLPLLSMVQGNSLTNSNLLFIEKIIGFLNINSIIHLSFFISLIFILKGVFKFFEGLVKASLEANLLFSIKTKMISGIMNYDYLYFSKKNTGYFINALNEQIKQYISSFGSYIKLLTNIITTFVYLAFAFYTSWQTLILAIFIGAGMMGFFQLFNNRIKDYSRRYSFELSNYNKIAIQSIHGFKYVVSTNQYKNIKNFIHHSISELFKYFKKSKIITSIVEASREPILIIGILTMISFHTIVLNAEIEKIAVIMLLLYRSMTYLSDSQGQWQKVLGKIGSIEIVNNELNNIKNNKERNGAIKLDSFNKKIEFKNVSFSYDNKSKVLDNINFTINAQTTIGIVGPSGSGKSTILDLITSLLEPSYGKIIIDDKDAKSLELESWRSQLGYVCQDSVMFDDTIANNIGMWKSDFVKDENYKKQILEASIAANSHSFIDDLEKGYNTKIGDRGMKLSGGQKQRIFIARELMKKPKILLLDEATSALDSESEDMIKKSIDTLKGKLTVIIVAHRISTIKNCDSIIVLKDGRIIEKGSFSSLEKKGSEFKKMLDAQIV